MPVVRGQVSSIPLSTWPPACTANSWPFLVPLEAWSQPARP